MPSPTTSADLRAMAAEHPCNFCVHVDEALLWAADELDRLEAGGEVLLAASRACEAREAVRRQLDTGTDEGGASAWQDAVEAEREWKRLKAATNA